MEFPSIIFFIVSYCISFICFAVGFIVLILGNSDSDHPLSNVIICALANWMFLFILISSVYAFLLRPSLENGPPYMPHVPADVMMDGLSQSSTRLERLCPGIISLFKKIITMNGGFNRIGRTEFTPLFVIYYKHTYFWSMLSMSIFYILFFVEPLLGLFFFVHISLLYSGAGSGLVTAYLGVKERFNRWGTWPPFVWIYGIWKIMKFALGMVGTILFQYYFKFASTHQLVAFLCFAVTWLGNLAMVQPSTDLGIFNFLVINACLGCAVNLFNLDIYTWIVFAACILLCFLREKLDSVTLRYDRSSRFTRYEQAPYTYLCGCLGCVVNLFNLDILTWIVFVACILVCFLSEKLNSVIFFRHDQQASSSSSIEDVVVDAPVIQQTLQLPQHVLPITAHDSSSVTLTHLPTLAQSSNSPPDPLHSISESPTHHPPQTSSIE